MFWWRVNSSLKIKILGTLTIWNCKIRLDLFPFNFFSPKNNGKQHLSCWQTAHLNKRLAVSIHSKSLMLHGQFLHCLSLLPHHMVLLTGCKGRAVTHLQKTFKKQLIILNWESLLWGQHSPSPDQCVAGGCDSWRNQEGSVHNFPFCRKWFSARFLFPFVCFLKHFF